MMDEMINNIPEEEDNIVELTDDDGVVSKFEYLATVPYEGDEYVALLVLDEEERGRVHGLEEHEAEQGDDDEPAAQGIGPEQAFHAFLTKYESRRRRACSRRRAW